MCERFNINKPACYFWGSFKTRHHGGLEVSTVSSRHKVLGSISWWGNPRLSVWILHVLHVSVSVSSHKSEMHLNSMKLINLKIKSLNIKTDLNRVWSVLILEFHVQRCILNINTKFLTSSLQSKNTSLHLNSRKYLLSTYSQHWFYSNHFKQLKIYWPLSAVRPY